MNWLRSIVDFFKRLFSGQPPAPGRTEDSAELEIEKERRRGMRGF
ncbi:MAG: hypothetical protein OEM97_10045 [Acidimicrobiia bacterium]|nr:hypothetical protein [Acidimicrobiia bacterium]